LILKAVAIETRWSDFGIIVPFSCRRLNLISGQIVRIRVRIRCILIPQCPATKDEYRNA
jgi:hypothetical protein